MKCFRIAVVALLSIVSGTSFSAERKCPDSIHNSYQCSQYLENELAKDFPKLFSRDGLRLVISLTNGKKKTYVDIPDEKNHGVEGKWFNLVQYYPEIGYALVAVQYYEGGTYYFVNLTTGKDKDIISNPVISPDRKRIAIANVDLESRYTLECFICIRTPARRFGRRVSGKSRMSGAPRNLRWENNQESFFYRVPARVPKV